MGAKTAADEDIPTHGIEWIAFLLSFRGVVLEGIEGALIVVSFGAAARAFPTARRSGGAGARTQRGSGLDSFPNARLHPRTWDARATGRLGINPDFSVGPG
jgi:hypothetical protein